MAALGWVALSVRLGQLRLREAILGNQDFYLRQKKKIRISVKAARGQNGVHSTSTPPPPTLAPVLP